MPCVIMETFPANYKTRQKIEQGFRFLKSPEFLTSSMYPKKPADTIAHRPLGIFNL